MIFGKGTLFYETKEFKQALYQFLSKSNENDVKGKNGVLVETTKGVQYRRNVTHRTKLIGERPLYRAVINQ